MKTPAYYKKWDIIRSFKEFKRMALKERGKNLNIKIEPPLSDKIKDHTELKGIGNKEYVLNLIKADLRTRVLSNTKPIRFKKLFYFSWDQLIKNGQTTATHTPPDSSKTQDDIILLNGFVNNCDVYDKEAGRFGSKKDPYLNTGFYKYDFISNYIYWGVDFSNSDDLKRDMIESHNLYFEWYSFTNEINIYDLTLNQLRAKVDENIINNEFARAQKQLKDNINELLQAYKHKFGNGKYLNAFIYTICLNSRHMIPYYFYKEYEHILLTHRPEYWEQYAESLENDNIKHILNDYPGPEDPPQATHYINTNPYDFY